MFTIIAKNVDLFNVFFKFRTDFNYVMLFIFIFRILISRMIDGKNKKFKSWKIFKQKHKASLIICNLFFFHKIAKYHYWREFLHDSAMITINIANAAHCSFEIKNTCVFAAHTTQTSSQEAIFSCFFTSCVNHHLFFWKLDRATFKYVNILCWCINCRINVFCKIDFKLGIILFKNYWFIN